ncbi:putative chaperone [Naematelia encephala]|uniref:Putative chaperone n=1 Tax=Naematelia encephala TaxID=71784 RepID=A0A1Y2AU04_9TREE|nr:putative chaperone [Naematelia encephala]
MSYRVVPPTASASNEQHVVSTKNTAHPMTGTHDTFRYGLRSAAQDVAAGNMSPLQARLEKWSSTQQKLQQTMQRNTFGLAVPLRQAMEEKIVRESPHHPLLLASTPSGLPLGGSHNIHLEILQGTDESLDAGEFMGGNASLNEVLDVSSVMERSRRI